MDTLKIAVPFRPAQIGRTQGRTIIARRAALGLSRDDHHVQHALEICSTPLLRGAAAREKRGTLHVRLFGLRQRRSMRSDRPISAKIMVARFTVFVLSEPGWAG